jgi:putative ABC transport system permease protein
MKIPLLRGRNFTHSDNDSSVPVALASKSFVDIWLHGQDPIGKRVRLGKARDLASDQNPWFTIVGVVNDVRHYGGEGIEGELLVPFDQHQRYHVPIVERYFVIRSQGDPAPVVQQLRRIVSDLDPNQPVENVITMDQLISRSVVSERTLTFLITTFAIVAVVLAAIGIYGVLSYWVSQRTREVGIRLALGASQENIMKVVLWKGGKLTLAGLMIGLPFAFGLTKLLPRLSFTSESHNPLAVIAITMFLGLVALLACYIPARRATKVDPMVALRYE